MQLIVQFIMQFDYKKSPMKIIIELDYKCTHSRNRTLSCRFGVCLVTMT